MAAALVIAVRLNVDPIHEAVNEAGHTDDRPATLRNVRARSEVK
jgi:hypothetical protein